MEVRRPGRPDNVRDMSNSNIIINLTSDQRRVFVELGLETIEGVTLLKTKARFTAEAVREAECRAREVGIAKGLKGSAFASVRRKLGEALVEAQADEAPAQVDDAKLVDEIGEDDRDVQAFRMREGGAPFRVIAETLGFKAPASARGAAMRGAAKVGGEMPETSRGRKVESVEPETFEPASVVDIERGQEVTISSVGEANPGGRFRFDRFASDGSLTCWGPVNDARQSWRNFRPERVRQVHRKVKDVRAAKQAEAAA